MAEPYKAGMTLQDIADDEAGIARLVPTRSDAEVAEEFRTKAMPLLEQLADIFTLAKAAGLIMGFSIAPDSFGKKFKVAEITLVKPL